MKDLILREGFDTEALLYDEARPTYPKELFDSLVEESGIDSGSQILEIGPGTGQATLPLAKLGCTITAVELGPQLGKVFESKFRGYPNVKLVASAFEDVNLGSNSFDLVYGATAFHWIEHEVRYKKSHQILKPAGYLAIIHTNHVSDGKGDEFFYASQPIYDKYFPENKNSKFHPPHQSDIRPEDIDKALFELTYFRIFPMDVMYRAEKYSHLLSTFSPNLALPPEIRQGFLDDIEGLINRKFGGQILKTYAMSLTIAKKINT